MYVTKMVPWEYHVLMILEFVNAKLISLEKNVMIAKKNFMVILIVKVRNFKKSTISIIQRITIIVFSL